MMRAADNPLIASTRRAFLLHGGLGGCHGRYIAAIRPLGEAVHTRLWI